MSEIAEGFLSFFVPLFMVLIHYWYVSLPLTALIVFLYTKTKKEGLRRLIRIYLSFIILSAVCTGIYILFY